VDFFFFVSATSKLPIDAMDTITVIRKDFSSATDIPPDLAAAFASFDLAFFFFSASAKLAKKSSGLAAALPLPAFFALGGIFFQCGTVSSTGDAKLKLTLRSSESAVRLKK
jgi:hypothetical protein